MSYPVKYNSEELKEHRRIAKLKYNSTHKVQNAEYRKKRRQQKLAVDSNCEKLEKRLRVLKKYGLTVDSFKAMFDGQNNVCAICHTDTWGKKGYHIDHCHVTGNVRGILCGKCNSGIGYLNDNPILTRAATEYLERHL